MRSASSKSVTWLLLEFTILSPITIIDTMPRGQGMKQNAIILI